MGRGAGWRQEGHGRPEADVPMELALGTGWPSRLAVRKGAGKGGCGGQGGRETSRQQCAKHQGHLGEEGESSFCKRNNICGVGAEHL